MGDIEQFDQGPMGGNLAVPFEDEGPVETNRFSEMESDHDARMEEFRNHVGLITGTCHDMCPLFERHARDFRGASAISIFERRVDTGSDVRISHRRAVKTFERSEAGKVHLPEETRTPEALRRTMDYLVEDILGWTHFPVTFADKYAFVRDRSRAVMNDLTVQHIRDELSIAIHERIARMLIMAGHLLCESDPNYLSYMVEIQRITQDQVAERTIAFNNAQNNQMLSGAMKTLIELYDEHRQRGVTFRTEPEFRAYQLLLMMDHNDYRTMEGRCLRLPGMKDSPELRFAMQVGNAWNSNNYARFFRLLVEAPYLPACIMSMHFGRLRARAMKVMRQSYRPPVMKIDTLLGLLCFESMDEFEFCIEQSVRDGSILLHRDSMTIEFVSEPFCAAREPPSFCSVKYVESKVKQNLSAVVNGLSTSMRDRTLMQHVQERSASAADPQTRATIRVASKPAPVAKAVQLPARQAPTLMLQPTPAQPAPALMGASVRPVVAKPSFASIVAGTATSARPPARAAAAAPLAVPAASSTPAVPSAFKSLSAFGGASVANPATAGVGGSAFKAAAAAATGRKAVSMFDSTVPSGFGILGVGASDQMPATSTFGVPDSLPTPEAAVAKSAFGAPASAFGSTSALNKTPSAPVGATGITVTNNKPPAVANVKNPSAFSSAFGSTPPPAYQTRSITSAQDALAAQQAAVAKEIAARQAAAQREAEEKAREEARKSAERAAAAKQEQERKEKEAERKRQEEAQRRREEEERKKKAEEAAARRRREEKIDKTSKALLQQLLDQVTDAEAVRAARLALYSTRMASNVLRDTVEAMIRQVAEETFEAARAAKRREDLSRHAIFQWRDFVEKKRFIRRRRENYERQVRLFSVSGPRSPRPPASPRAGAFKSGPPAIPTQPQSIREWLKQDARRSPVPLAAICEGAVPAGCRPLSVGIMTLGDSGLSSWLHARFGSTLSLPCPLGQVIGEAECSGDRSVTFVHVNAAKALSLEDVDGLDALLVVVDGALLDATLPPPDVHTEALFLDRLRAARWSTVPLAILTLGTGADKNSQRSARDLLGESTMAAQVWELSPSEDTTSALQQMIERALQNVDRRDAEATGALGDLAAQLMEAAGLYQHLGSLEAISGTLSDAVATRTFESIFVLIGDSIETAARLCQSAPLPRGASANHSSDVRKAAELVRFNIAKMQHVAASQGVAIGCAAALSFAPSLAQDVCQLILQSAPTVPFQRATNLILSRAIFPTLSHVRVAVPARDYEQAISSASEGAASTGLADAVAKAQQDAEAIAAKRAQAKLAARRNRPASPPSQLVPDIKRMRLMLQEEREESERFDEMLDLLAAST